VGCGGRPYESCVPRDGRYLGFDLTPTVGSRPDCWARADALPLPTGCAALVLCTQVLEHLPDPAACVSEMARLLSANGSLVITAPQSWNLHEAPHDYFRFTRFGLSELCRRAGLDVLEILPQGGLGALIGLSILGFAGRKVLGEGDGHVTASAGRSWRRQVLRFPLALHNVLFAALDGWTGRGLGAEAFAVNHLVVARRRPASGRSPDSGATSHSPASAIRSS